MSQDEIITTLTSIARRERQESYSKAYDHLLGEVVKEVTYTFQPSVEESTEALNILVKFLGTPLNNEKTSLEIEKLRKELTNSGEQEPTKIVIVDNWGDSDDSN